MLAALAAGARNAESARKPDPLAALYADQAKLDLSNNSWFQDTRTSGRLEAPTASESFIGTDEVSKKSAMRGLVGKLVLPSILAAVIGTFIGGYLVFDGQGGKARAPKAAASTPAPAAVKAAAGRSDAAW